MSLQPVSYQSILTPALLDEANGPCRDTLSIDLSATMAITLAAISALAVATGIGLSLAGMVVPIIITFSIALISGVAGAILFATTSSCEKPTYGPDSVSYKEFTSNLSDEVKKAIEKKWSEIFDIHQLGIQLSTAMKKGDYTDPIFDHPDIEYLILYAASSNLYTENDRVVRDQRINVFEASNALIYHSLCKDFGRDQVQVHFLTNENGKLDPSVKEMFDYATKSVLHEKSQDDIIDSLCMLPRSLQVFFTVPEDEEASEVKRNMAIVKMPSPTDSKEDREIFNNRTIRQEVMHKMSPVVGYPGPFTQTKINDISHHFEITPFLLYSYLNNAYSHEIPKVIPILGESPFSRFENFFIRDICIPFSLTPPPESADNAKVTRATHFTLHDYFHLWTDAAVPMNHRKAFADLREVIKDFPKSQENVGNVKELEGMDPQPLTPPYELYCDRLFGYHFQPIDEKQKNTSSFFWMNLIERSLKFVHIQHLLSQDPSMTLVEALQPENPAEPVYDLAKKLIARVVQNRSQWENDFGISLDGIIEVKKELEEMVAKLNLVLQAPLNDSDQAPILLQANIVKLQIKMLEALEQAKQKLGA